MPVTVETLESLFPKDNDYGDFARFEFDDKLGKFVGDIVYHGFTGLAIPDRQKQIWDLLREKLGDEAQQVSLVLAYSPQEWEEGLEREAG